MIWKHNMKKIAVIGTGFRPKGDDIPPDEIINIKGEQFQPTLVETSIPAFPVNEINRQISETSIIEAGLRAAKNGFQGVFINTVGDYGLNALKSGLKIPVVGAGHSSMLIASSIGKNFSIVTIWPPQLKFIYEGLLKLYDLEKYCKSIRCVSIDEELETLPNEENFVTDMRKNELNQQERILKEIENAVKKDGADTIILGCTCMSPAAKKIAEKSIAPIINPMTSGYKYLEMLMNLKLSQSEISFPTLGPIGSEHYTSMANGIAKMKLSNIRG